MSKIENSKKLLQKKIKEKYNKLKFLLKAEGYSCKPKVPFVKDEEYNKLNFLLKEKTNRRIIALQIRSQIWRILVLIQIFLCFVLYLLAVQFL